MSPSSIFDRTLIRTDVCRWVGAVIIQVSYGRQLWKDHGKQLVENNIEAVNMMGPAFSQFWLVDYLHWRMSFFLFFLFFFADIHPLISVRHIPSWFPGAGFKRLGIKSTRLMNHIRQFPFTYALNEYNSQAGRNDSLASELIESHGDIELVKNVIGILYAGGSLAILSFSFFWSHSIFPFGYVYQLGQIR